MKKLKLKLTPQSLSRIDTTSMNQTRAKNLAIMMLFVSLVMFSSESFAQTNTGGADAFQSVYSKLSGWANGTAGKLITLITILFGAVGGVLGFNHRIVFGAIGVGLLLASASSLVDILF